MLSVAIRGLLGLALHFAARHSGITVRYKCSKCADYLVLMSDSGEGMRLNLLILESFCQLMGMQINHSKCHGFLIEKKGGETED